LEQRHQAKTRRQDQAWNELPPSRGIDWLDWDGPVSIFLLDPAGGSRMLLSPNRRDRKPRDQYQRDDEKSAREANHEHAPNWVAGA
jgi:hypothetical protein